MKAEYKPTRQLEEKIEKTKLKLASRARFVQFFVLAGLAFAFAFAFACAFAFAAAFAFALAFTVGLALACGGVVVALVIRNSSR